MEFVDTHCHIHFPDYELDPEEVLKSANQAGVTSLLCVGCTLKDSELGIEFANRHKNVWATIGLHPHEAKEYINDDVALHQFRDLASQHGALRKVVAVGECGLDYYYQHSSKADQKKLFRFQLDLAVEHNLPLIFHVREAFDDFFEILDEYNGIRGVVHSFTGDEQTLSKVLERGLYVGLNGIVTFTKNQHQLDAAKAVPVDKLLLETDAPFLTPTPYRGTICQPKHIRDIARFLSDLRDEPLQLLADATTQNAKDLFGLESQK